MVKSIESTCENCGRVFKSQLGLYAHSKYCQPEPENEETETALSLESPERDETPVFTETETEFPQTDIDLAEVVHTVARQVMSNIETKQTLDAQFLPKERDTIHVLVQKLAHYDGEWPDITQATVGSAGTDLRAAIEHDFCLGIDERIVVPTGIAIAIPRGYVGLVCPRSGLAANYGISVTNAPGVIDCDYRGEVKVILSNHTTRKFWVHPGDRIAQLVVTAVPDVAFVYEDTLPETGRGANGFGSTGVSL